MTHRTKPRQLSGRLGNDGARSFNFSNHISVWSTAADKHVLIALPELVNTYQNTREMIKKISTSKLDPFANTLSSTRARIKDYSSELWKNKI